MAPLRDNCVCWCHANGDGCSPLTVLYKTHENTSLHECRGIEVMKGMKWDPIDYNSLLLDFDLLESRFRSGTGQQKDGISSWQPTKRALELLRLLTFEALEIRHTCCIYEELDIETPYYLYAHCLPATLYCKPETVEDIRHDANEQASAKLLDEIMAELVNCMGQQYQGKNSLISSLDPGNGVWRRYTRYKKKRLSR